MLIPLFFFLCCIWFCMPLHGRILGLKCFCMLVNMKICNHLSFWLFLVSISHTYLKNIWLGLPLPLVVPLSYSLFENSTSLLKRIFQEYKLLYVPSIKIFIFWWECGKVRKMITVQNGFKILGIPEYDRRMVREGKNTGRKEGSLTWMSR